ncbi:origin recognition complex subunit 1 isoform X1 [Nasonia vitripennis]|uniref:Origin recognition complex subunit 1 n=1 Tax=Nasonia vitripennis TaxID=7425 RepID=A0A7M7QIP3_NASVI|nr:origin recognition complex subunit 1 isoform X1 [Nasonia vitripennis]XP_016845370.1 origin recognition complex subunit 1 isoform X1 [Nasonia vitripennis]XP_016845371.1 origin recognition complex subunit 1 isoform X1 [Nasonia vitripennis]XP_031786158.1 origin recognition complex subunit 1 isoform X1 [Nasonia vitripennis]XP_031786159.1 origin recognition complex subunit 1 isoform X1 [Nasonia vitripennis]
MRRSTKKKDDANSGTPQTRRKSTISNASTTSNLNRTPKTNVRKKLTKQDIDKDLNCSSGEEEDKCSGKPEFYHCKVLEKDDQSITLRLIRSNPGYNDTIQFELGLKQNEKNSTKRKSVYQKQCERILESGTKFRKSIQPNNNGQTPRKNSAVSKTMDVEEPSISEKRELRRKSCVNLNENYLSNQQFDPRRSIKPNHEKMWRKRGNNNEAELSEDEGDENLMKNANKSPKRPKRVDDNDKTYSEEEDNESSDDSQFSDDDEDFVLSCKENNRNKPNIPKTPSKNTKKISMETPTKSMAKMCLTPSMHQRTVNIVKPSTPLQEARLKLHVSVLPKSLPCREEQFNDIYSFLHARLSDKSGGCIYISGVPGTGKTATVNEVIRCLKKSMDAGKLTNFEFIDINGMKLSEPRQAYVQIWKQLTGQKTTWEEAHKLLQERFSKSNSKRGMTLLLVDELDLLCTKRQDVVYNLLDWPTKTGAKLVVVTIANTMDLPERVLMGKVTSRLGLSRLTFPPYNYKQLEEIVASRLRGFNAFGGETIQLVARKVAAVSGDARRALDICRRATEIAENNDREIVSMIDVKRAVDEMIASPKIQAIKHCSEMERVFLQAVCSEVHRTGVEEVVFQNVYLQLGPLCTLNGEKTPNVTEALAMCARLGAWRLLLCEHSRLDVHQRLLLNVSTDDVQFAIKAVEV